MATSAEAVSELAGVYYSEELDGALSLAALDARLFVSNGSGSRTPLMQRSAARFALPGGASLEFARGADGRISGFEYSSSRVRGLKFIQRTQSE